MATDYTVLHLATEAETGTETEHAEEPSGTDLVLPDPAELLWGTIVFAVVLVVLTRVAFPKIRETVAKREETIKNNLEEAENAKNEAAKQLDDYKKQLAEARGEANRIIEEARQQAEKVREEVTQKAEREAEQIVQRAQDQLEAERNRTVQELQGTIRDLSIELAEKVVGRTLDAQSHKDMVDAYIKEVAGMPKGNGSARS